MNFVFLMDPLSTVIMEKDTSFILMLEAHQRGHKVFYLGGGALSIKDNQVYFFVTHVTPKRDAQNPFLEVESTQLSQEDVDVVFIRSDPPFDLQYLNNTWLLDLLSKDIPVINNPTGIRSVNEKIWAMQFPSLIPKTLIGCKRDDLLDFLNIEKEIIAKPTDSFGGQSVFRIKSGDSNANVILETLTDNWSKEIILQHFVEESEKGDKRILLLDGEILGAILRVHSKG